MQTVKLLLLLLLTLPINTINLYIKLTFKTFSSLQLLKRTPYNAIINN